MDWTDVVDRDAFLAGSLLARSFEWWQHETPFEEADRVGLQGEKRDRFFAGWTYELEEQARAEAAKQKRELEAFLASLSGKGDPTTW